ncbi:hypothetical protein [Halocola ammonii]
MKSRASGGELTKEMYVFNKVIESKQNFTRAELKHALEYINEGVREKFGLEPVELSLEEIPTVRPKIKIEKILNAK